MRTASGHFQKRMETTAAPSMLPAHGLSMSFEWPPLIIASELRLAGFFASCVRNGSEADSASYAAMNPSTVVTHAPPT